MRFLCNENIPSVLVATLVDKGHDVCWVRTLRPGISDREVLQWATAEGRVCVTFDKDFGELAATTSITLPIGVILLRMPVSPQPGWAMGIASLISAREDWPGHFSVIEPGRIRLRKLRPA